MKRLFYLVDNSGHFSMHILIFPDMIQKANNMKGDSYLSKQ